MCFIKIIFFSWETFEDESLFTKLDRILSRGSYKSFPAKNLNFDKVHTQPLSLLCLDSSTYIETLDTDSTTYSKRGLNRNKYIYGYFQMLSCSKSYKMGKKM